jgi:hypothetical protein
MAIVTQSTGQVDSIMFDLNGSRVGPLAYGWKEHRP